MRKLYSKLGQLLDLGIKTKQKKDKKKTKQKCKLK